MDNTARRQQQNDTPPRGGNWSKLETTGDVRRLLRWLILQAKADKIDSRKAGVMGQLALYLLKAMETSALESRVNALERDHTTPSQSEEPEVEIVA